MPIPRIVATVVVATVLGGGTAGCADAASSTSSANPPAKVEPIEGTSSKRIVLVPRAVERLDIRTVAIRSATPQEMEGVTPVGQAGRTAVPYDAVLYDKTGASFTYTNPKGHEYVRQPVTLDGVKNKVAIIAAGPPSGTMVVTVGGIELYGVETGVGK